MRWRTFSTRRPSRVRPQLLRLGRGRRPTSTSVRVQARPGLHGERRHPVGEADPHLNRPVDGHVPLPQPGAGSELLPSPGAPAPGTSARSRWPSPHHGRSERPAHAHHLHPPRPPRRCGASTRSGRPASRSTVARRLHAGGARHLRRPPARGRAAPRAAAGRRPASWCCSAATAPRRPGWPGSRRAPTWAAATCRRARSAQRVAAITQERALLPVVTLDARGAVAATASTVAARRRCRADVHDQVDGRRRRAGAGVGGSRSRASSATTTTAELAITRLPRSGSQATEGDVVGVRRRRPPGITLEGRSSSPTVPLDAATTALVAYRARARQPRRHDRGQPRRAPSTTSTPSSSTSCGSRCAAPGRCSSQGKGVVARRRSAIATARTSAGSAQITGPARDLDVYVLGWDDYVAPLAASRRRQPRPGARRELEARRRRPTPTWRAALRSAATPQRLERWQAWLTDPDATSPPTAPADRPGRRRAHRQGPGARS